MDTKSCGEVCEMEGRYQGRHPAGDGVSVNQTLCGETLEGQLDAIEWSFRTPLSQSRKALTAVSSRAVTGLLGA